MPPRQPISPLEAHLGYWLRYVSNQVSHAFAQKLAARDVTVAEWVFLRELYDREQAAAPSVLADRLGMTRGAISKLADRLLAKQLIHREEGGIDRRFQALALTSAGRDMVPDLASLADLNDEEFFGHLEPAAKEAIAVAMKEIVRRQGSRAMPID